MKKYLLLALLPSALHAADPVWIEYGPDGPQARTIVTSGGKCPSIVIDGVATQMRTRALPAKDYEVTSCQAALPANAQSASIGGIPLAVSKLGRTAKVAILGDTGCRRKEGDPEIQDCSDPKKWPFSTVAASIAEWDPDLVLHVGDYYYREAKCKDSKCTDVPYSWKRWDEDFFTPAEPLLANAPWLLVRGNHEKCSRAAEGWFRFLEPRSYVWEGKKACKSNLDFTPPYSVTIGGMQIIVLDTSALEEDDAGQGAMFGGQLKLFANAKPGAWLMLHHPIWGARKKAVVTPTLWNAWETAGSATDSIALVLTGHIHLLEMLSFADGRPPHVVAGNGGTDLASKAEDPTGKQIGGRTVSAFTQDQKYGFIAATPSATGWTFDIRKADGTSKGKCAVTTTSIVCD